MSQYPPYPPPYPPSFPPGPSPYPAGEDPRRPARRSAILMGVLGALGVAVAALIVAVAWVITPEMIATAPNAAQLQRQIQQMQTQTGMTWDGVRRAMMVVGVFMIVPSVLFIVLAFYVRGGGRVSVMLGLVFSVLIALFLALQGLVEAAMGGGDAGGACVTLVVVGLLILLCSWLWQAVRAAPYVEALGRPPVAPQPPGWMGYHPPPGYAAYPPAGYGWAGYGPPGGAWPPPAAPPDYRAYFQPPAPPPAGVYGYAQPAAPGGELAAPSPATHPTTPQAAAPPPAAGASEPPTDGGRSDAPPPQG